MGRDRINSIIMAISENERKVKIADAFNVYGKKHKISYKRHKIVIHMSMTLKLPLLDKKKRGK